MKNKAEYTLDESINHVKGCQAYIKGALELELKKQNKNFEELPKFDGGTHDFKPFSFIHTPSSALIDFIESDHYNYRENECHEEIANEIRNITQGNSEARLNFLSREVQIILKQNESLHSFADKHRNSLTSFFRYYKDYRDDSVKTGLFYSKTDHPIFENYYAAVFDRILICNQAFNKYFPDRFGSEIDTSQFKYVNFPSFKNSPFEKKEDYILFLKLHEGFNVKDKVRWTHIYNFMFHELKIQPSQEKFFGFVKQYFKDVATRKQKVSIVELYFKTLHELLDEAQ